MSFNFGAPNTSAGTAGTFSFGQTQSSGFSFGAPSAPTSTAPATGFSFGASQPAVGGAAGGFSFGAPSGAPAPTQSAAGGLNFGTPASTTKAPAPATGFSFGATASNPPATSATGFSFSAPLSTQKPAAATGFSFGAPAAASSAANTNPTGSFTLSAGVSAPSGFSLPTASTRATITSSSISAAAPAVKSSFNFSAPSGSAPPKSTATAGLSFGAPPSVSASTSSSAGGFKLTPSSTSTATAATSTTISAELKQVSYKTLEETIDKWLHDLNEQEKSFLNQASQVNTWDKQLIENGEKISEVNSEVERLKAEQGRLDRELDFILSQQDELEKLLTPIEAQVNTHTMVTHTQHADIERERTYSLAENIDAQLKHMMQSLNEIIDHINSSNTGPANPADESMAQIAKILNAHMDSLQWIDQNTNKLQQRVKDVSQVMDSHRKEQERSFHLSYE